MSLPFGRDWHGLGAEYALDALGERDRIRFERHLARCPACRRDVRELREVAARLGVTVSERPPAGLKPRVLAAVAAASFPQADPGSRRPARPRAPARGWPRRPIVPVAAVACLALAIAFGVLFAVTRDQVDSVSSQEDEIAAVLSAPGTRVVSDETSIGGRVTADVAPRLREMVVTTFGMPTLPGSEAYQLWLIDPGGGATSVGLLTRIPGRGTAPVVASGLDSGDRVGLTMEPAGGTSKPTTSLIAVISLPS